MIKYNYLNMNLTYDPYFGFLTFKMFPFFKLFAVFYFDTFMVRKILIFQTLIQKRLFHKF